MPSAVGSGHTVVDRLRRGRPILVHGDGQSLWTMTHRTDFAKGLVGLLGNPRAVGEAFHITSDEVLTWDEIYRTIARAAGVAEPKLVHMASETIARFDAAAGEKLLGDRSSSMVFDNAKIKRFVPGFAAVVPFEAGARECLAWLDADPAAPAALGRGECVDGPGDFIDAMISRDPKGSIPFGSRLTVILLRFGHLEGPFPAVDLQVDAFADLVGMLDVFPRQGVALRGDGAEEERADAEDLLGPGLGHERRLDLLQVQALDLDVDDARLGEDPPVRQDVRPAQPLEEAHQPPAGPRPRRR